MSSVNKADSVNTYIDIKGTVIQMRKFLSLSVFAHENNNNNFAIKNVNTKLKISTEQKIFKLWIILFIKLHACINLYEC